MRKWYSLIDKVYDLTKLEESFYQVKSNRGSRTKGVDNVSVEDFEEHLADNLYQIQQELQTGVYTPQAVKRVYIDKPDGSKRPLGIPTIRDRVVQQALLNILQPIFEPDFHPSSYGYRPNRSAHHAVAKAERFTRQYGLRYVVDMDLSKCFDSLDQDLILQSVNKKVSDGKVLQLIDKFLKSGVLDNSEYIPTDKGCPQGGIISPLLMNIYLDNFDQYMKSEGIRIVRYADDILIFADSKSKSGAYKARAEQYLAGKLRLKVNQRKTHLTNLWKGIPYLGFVIRNMGVTISRKSIKKFKDKVRALTPRNKGKSVHYYIRELTMLLRGFSNYFRIAKCKSWFSRLMEWIRRRLRMMIMKAWKSWKPLHKQLRRKGYKGNFEKISMSRWRNSNSPLVNMALTNTWFEENGLYNMKEVTVNTLHQYYNFVLN
ncbi:MAG TPA: group II intron reverse transcriptase/maturase [Halanaerobiales bacterium]|nr:group II intron reverse transcriptase/maturase [Halanaerobiales bacterium]